MCNQVSEKENQSKETTNTKQYKKKILKYKNMQNYILKVHTTYLKNQPNNQDTSRKLLDIKKKKIL